MVTPLPMAGCALAVWLIAYTDVLRHQHPLTFTHFAFYDTHNA